VRHGNYHDDAFGELDGDQDMKRFREWLIPELRRVPDEEQRRIMFKQTLIVAMGDWAMIAGLLIPILAPALRWMESYAKRLGTVGYFPTGLIVVTGILIAWTSLGILVQRSTVRRDVRKLLHSDGIAICVPCGYDLTGNSSGKCPECGVAIAPATLAKT